MKIYKCILQDLCREYFKDTTFWTFAISHLQPFKLVLFDLLMTPVASTKFFYNMLDWLMTFGLLHSAKM